MRIMRYKTICIYRYCNVSGSRPIPREQAARILGSWLLAGYHIDQYEDETAIYWEISYN